MKIHEKINKHFLNFNHINSRSKAQIETQFNFLSSASESPTEAP